MSYYDYVVSQSVDANDYPFASLIMAAARKADFENLKKLQKAFPEIVWELEARYNLPGGKTEAERASEQPTADAFDEL